MKTLLKHTLALAAVAAAAQAAAEVTFYDQEGFQGETFTAQQQINNFQGVGFNDRASSVVVTGQRWEVCDDVRFRGRCVVLRPGEYPSLSAVGLDNRISSVRAVPDNARVDDRRYAPMPMVAQVTFYEGEGFGGRSFTTNKLVNNFQREGFNDRASSVVVAGGERWEVCEDRRFAGRCVILRAGRYPSLASMGLSDRIQSVRAAQGDARRDPSPAVPSLTGQITFYENEGFGGRSFATDRVVENFQRNGFNDRASSAVVVGERWEVCEDSEFRGRCAVLRPGQYPSLAAMGLNDRISSVRDVSRDARIEDRRYAPAPGTMAPQGAADFRRRNEERLFEANVTSVRAVVGPPEQRCWIERGQVQSQNNSNNVPGAIVGALIGGILGHQVGGGTGKDIATAGGVVTGAVVGSRVGGGNQPQTQDVQRCENVPSQAQPQFWDVTYEFRGQEHRVQMTSPPGQTVTVNGQGEPRR